MSRAGERTVLIEPLLDEDGLMQVDRQRAADVVNDLLGALLGLGGTLEITSDRVKIGEIPGTHDGRPTILAETVGFIVQFSPSAPMSDGSRTQRAMAVARRDGGLSVAGPEPDPLAHDGDELEGEE